MVFFSLSFNVNTIVFCSGKIYYELIEEWKKRGYEQYTIIIRIEVNFNFNFYYYPSYQIKELSPFLVKLLEDQLKKHNMVSSNVGSRGTTESRYMVLYSTQTSTFSSQQKSGIYWKTIMSCKCN